MQKTVLKQEITEVRNDKTGEVIEKTLAPVTPSPKLFYSWMNSPTLRL